MAVSQSCVGTNITSQTGSEDEETLSVFYNVLPTLVRRSIPKVRSLRRSISNYNAPLIGHSRAASIDNNVLRAATPPPAYREVRTSLDAPLSDDEAASSTACSGSGKRASFVENDSSGIQWKYASQGLNLLTLSAQESSGSTSDAPFSRQLYTDAMTYLLRGLPDGLSEEELTNLRTASPEALLQPQVHVGQLILQDDVQDMPMARPETEPTVLHRLVAMTVFQSLVIFSFLWPYLQVLLRGIYEYERHHHVSERIASSTWITANAITKRTVAAANTVCTWNDGQVGESLESMVAWWIQGIAGGLCEGVGEGMEVLGVKITAPRRQKRTARYHRA